MSKRIQIIKTEDGSDTIINRDFGETYHSTKGAVSESMYVFIDNGFRYIKKNKISIFEVGFGTGLNAYLTCLEALRNNVNVNYVAIEKYPIDALVIENLDFRIDNQKNMDIFKKIQETQWGNETQINKSFTLTKIQGDFTKWQAKNEVFDLIYLDAFSFETQPEMWSENNFLQLSKSLKKQGVLVTYSSKGIVKQNLRNAGFEVKRLSGFKKRHMIRATKKL